MPAGGDAKATLPLAVAPALAKFLAARSFAARLETVSRLARLVRSPRMLPRFLHALDADRALAEQVRAALGKVIAGVEGVRVLSEAGIPSARGFLGEAGDRLSAKLVPKARANHDLARLLAAIFASGRDVEILEGRRPDDWRRMVAVFPEASDPAWQSLWDDAADALWILAARLEAEGLSEKVRRRAAPRRIADSPHHRLSRCLIPLLETAPRRASPSRESVAACRRELAACRADLGSIRKGLETRGVNVDLVFGIEVMERCLERMDALVSLLAATEAKGRATALHRLLAQIARSSLEDRSLRHLVRWNTHLLFRRIVERSGQAGEHYVAHDRRDYWRMWRLAAAGGLLTVVTAGIKTAVHTLHLAPFQEGVLYGLNYAVSFVVMQHFGWLLATKQPAMTAAALASLLRGEEGVGRLRALVGYTARICHSQLATAIANVGAVALGAWGLDRLWRLAFHRAVVAEETALELHRALSPLDSGTVFYAALTGVVLWLASVCGGWFDNWIVYNDVPGGIEQHPAAERLGRARLARWAEGVRHHAAGWGTNVSLGMMLGLTPALGAFLGVPLDVRHVTLSTGQLALASSALEFHQSWSVLLRGLAGIGTMFVLNLGVSFLLSLFTAARAYGLSPRQVAALLGRLAGYAIRHPLDFILPPRRRLGTEAAPNLS